MKLIRLLAIALCCVTVLSGCGKNSADTYASVSDENVAIDGTGKIKVGDIYSEIRGNNRDEIADNILKKIMLSQIDMENSDIKSLYEKYLNEYFEETFVDSGSYNYNGNFNEELVVKYLNSESYVINCGEGYNSGVLNSDLFACDYTDYIEQELNYDMYLKLLKIMYIIDQKSSLIDKNEGRKVEYYSVSKGTGDTVRKQLETYVKSISENYNSDDDTLIRSISDIAETKRSEELKSLTEEYAKLSTSSDQSFTNLNKFTNCGSYKCTIEEGLDYQTKLIMDKDYYVSKVVIKGEEILYTAASNILFSSYVEDYLYTIGEKQYLMSPAYASQDDKRINDIILYDSSSSVYYLATVEVIDSSSSFADKALVAEKLVDKVSTADVLSYYFDKSEIEIYDKEIREYFISKYGEFKGE